MNHGLHHRVLRGLSASPARPALYAADGTVTYDELHATASTWAGRLRERAEVGPVAVLAGKTRAAYAGLLAGLYAGVPVVPMNPSFPPERLRSMLEAVRVTALIADDQGAALAGRLGEITAQVPLLLPDELGSGRALTEPSLVDPQDVAYVLFTSGSTGRPKGVPITHGNAIHYFDLLDSRYDFTGEDVFSQTFDLNFDCAMFDLFCAWGAGAAVHPLPGQAYRDLPAFVRERRMTVWFSTPSAIGLVRRLGGLREGSLPGLRWSFFAGEALRCSDAAEWQLAADQSRVENLYGPTELTVTVSRHRWEGDRSEAGAVNGVVPIGAIHPGHDCLVLGLDGRPTDGDGELCVTGTQLTPGYLDPADGIGRFLELDGRRWYRTGDRVRRLDGGEYAYLGRLDSQVQVQGWRVELAEIDHAVRGCAGVADAVTVTRETESGLELVVFYTGTPVPAMTLVRHLRDVLPERMIPRSFHHLDDLPLNANRKVDRPRLASAAREI
ncbi:MAG: AMP-binding protein [Hamadaea sp.]|uniref:AMP-binding protein n=1 Tax=Hamadaea sp. TaxID=2024425 RepID=UPI0017CFA872|nr:AMP-binding protein [Hamadaea sp.]NUR69270.1 AMP-binding protein [Hamadaea sp.]NUT22026.1 AMP-binding protein [Hamadaea sp.]